MVAPTAPDLTIFLDLPADAGLARAEARRMEMPALPHANDDEAEPDAARKAPPPEPDAYERRDPAFHARLRAACAAHDRSPRGESRSSRSCRAVR